MGKQQKYDQHYKLFLSEKVSLRIVRRLVCLSFRFDQAFGQKASSESVFTIRIPLRMLLRPIPLLVLTSRRSAV